MTLVVDKQSRQNDNINGDDLNAALNRWLYSSPSAMLHHGRSCCSIAREWLFSMDHSQLNGHHKLMGPRWLRKRYNWGPSKWPMTWCQAVEQKQLDCGALAALSREIFVARSVGCHAVQLIQQYTEETTGHWSTKWSHYGASTNWIQRTVIYHEACAVEIAINEIKIWDPSAASWVNPKQIGGYGSILALRLVTNSTQKAKPVTWRHHQIKSEEWQIIKTNYSAAKKYAVSER